MGKKEEEEPRLLIDACLTAALPEYLRHHLGIDAIRSDAVLPQNAPDKEVVAFAREQGRVIVTENAEDFRDLAESNPGHPGLVIIAGGVGKARQIELVHTAVERILLDAAQGSSVAGWVYDVAADGHVRRYRLPKGA